MAQKLFVGGLPFSTSNDQLRDLYAEVGEVASATVVTDRDTGRSRGFGFVKCRRTKAPRKRFAVQRTRLRRAAAPGREGQVPGRRWWRWAAGSGGGGGGFGRGGGGGNRW